MSVVEHQYPIPSEDELLQAVGAATPHFALQIRDRVAQYAATLPPDHPRRPELAAHIADLERLAIMGEHGEEHPPDLPERPSLSPPEALQPPG